MQKCCVSSTYSTWRFKQEYVVHVTDVDSQPLLSWYVVNTQWYRHYYWRPVKLNWFRMIGVMMWPPQNRCSISSV